MGTVFHLSGWSSFNEKFSLYTESYIQMIEICLNYWLSRHLNFTFVVHVYFPQLSFVVYS